MCGIGVKVASLSRAKKSHQTEKNDWSSYVVAQHYSRSKESEDYEQLEDGACDSLEVILYFRGDHCLVCGARGHDQLGSTRSQMWRGAWQYIFYR